MKRNLNDHVNSVHHKLKLHKCPTCDLALSSSTSLRVHIESVHNNKKGTCKICGKEMKKKSLYEHMRTVHNDNPPTKQRKRK